MNKLQNYIVWLDGFLAACDGQMNVSKTNVIKNKLNNLFEHETIDKRKEKKSLKDKSLKDKSLKELVELGKYKDELYRC